MKPKRKRAPGAGRPIADPSGKKRPFTIWLSPAEQANVLRHGPTISDGLRKLAKVCNCDASGWPATSRIGTTCEDCGGVVIDANPP